MSRRVAVVAIDLPDDVEADEVQEHVEEQMGCCDYAGSLLGVENADGPWIRIEEGD